MATIKADDFSLRISELLDDYRAEVREGVAQAVEKAGNQALKTVKERSPVRKGQYGGGHKKGWRKKVQRGGVYGDVAAVTVYNATDGSLVHLLEHGHQKVDGGRVEGIPHVAPAVEAAERVLDTEVRAAIEEAADAI